MCSDNVIMHNICKPSLAFPRPLSKLLSLHKHCQVFFTHHHVCQKSTSLVESAVDFHTCQFSTNFAMCESRKGSASVVDVGQEHSACWKPANLALESQSSWKSLAELIFPCCYQSLLSLSNFLNTFIVQALHSFSVGTSSLLALPNVHNAIANFSEPSPSMLRA